MSGTSRAVYFEIICNTIQQTWPNAVLKVQEPLRPDGVSHLDVNHNDRHIAVMWFPQEKRYGLSDISPDKDVGYGEGPEYMTNDPLNALIWIGQRFN
jgi:hypothetical protein